MNKSKKQMNKMKSIKIKVNLIHGKRIKKIILVKIIHAKDMAIAIIQIIFFLITKNTIKITNHINLLILIHIIITQIQIFIIMLIIMKEIIQKKKQN